MLRPHNVMIEDRVELEKIPLSALSKRSITALSNRLNAKKVLPSEDGYQRDYRGLVTLSGLNYVEYSSVINQNSDPTEKILQLWMKNETKANLDQLQQVLGLIERWDVLDDTNLFFSKYTTNISWK